MSECIKMVILIKHRSMLMERSIPLLIGLCVLSWHAQGRTLQDRCNVGNRNSDLREDGSIPTATLLLQRDQILDALLAANKDELAKVSGSEFEAEYLPGMDGVYTRDLKGGRRVIYLTEDKVHDGETGKNLNAFKWWMNWWKPMLQGPPSNTYSHPRNRAAELPKR